MVKNANNESQTNIIIAFKSGQPRMCGTQAAQQQEHNLKGTINYITRFLGSSPDQLREYESKDDFVMHDFDVDS